MTDLIDPGLRIFNLEGASNFRDVGGYRTRSGQTVRTGIVFRAGSLAGLTPADHVAITRLNIKQICDLRSNRERAHGPANWPADAPVPIWSRDHEHSVGNILKEILEHPRANAEEVRDWMIGLYGELPFEQAESYAALFRQIAAGGLPMLFHCAAGKDRTGVAAALLLDLLGVDRATIEQDFLLTNLFFERISRLVLSGPSFSRFAHLAPAVLQPLLGVEPAYLQAMYEAVARKYGSVRQYVRNALRVDEAMEAQIRARLLEG